MAVRYSGNVEIRMRRENKLLVANVRYPGGRHRIEVSSIRHPLSPAGYDQIATSILNVLMRRHRLPIERHQGRIRIQRIFVSPCPHRL